MGKKMFPNKNEVIVCGTCGKSVIAKDWPKHNEECRDDMQYGGGDCGCGAGEDCR